MPKVWRRDDVIVVACVVVRVKDLWPDMAQPTYASQQKMENMVVCLEGQPQVVATNMHDVARIGGEVKGRVGREATRRSTNGGCIMVEDNCVKARGTTQREAFSVGGPSNTLR